MSKRMRIPDKAVIVSQKSGKVNCGKGKGRPVNLTLYSAYMSKGYQSGYENVKTYYMRIEFEDTRDINIWSRSGKNLLLAEEDFEEGAALIS